MILFSDRFPMRRTPAVLEQFQEKRVTVFRPELRQYKGLESFRDSEKSGSALTPRHHS
ncbi:hypothetical protein EMEDMD4_60004 [Sinorhizobium medicae]|uniref:Uncharacterized protein n=1 Tax=Sinorhizobium medicae TaxID=110321 RepID=A0A508X3K2_9HYPH|nr:hypothetical protein EMEDMD4_60004 [Sinorhizobium medicae]